MRPTLLTPAAASALLLCGVAGMGRAAAEPATFLRGDANADGALSLTDPIFTLDGLFRGGEQPGCGDASDANDDGAVDIADAVYLLAHLFLGGPPPTEPFSACGQDPTLDDLGCEGFQPCSRPPGGVEVAWIARYNGPANGGDAPMHLAVDAAGAVLVTGSQQREEFEFESGYATVKYDARGQELWVARYVEQLGWNQPDAARWVGVDGDGNVVVVGYSAPLDAGWAHSTTIKYDPEGNELWLAHFDPPGGLAFYPTTGAMDASGAVYATDWSDADMTIKLDSSGHVLWTAPRGGVSLAVDGKGNVLVAGRTVTAKYSPDGRELWATSHPDPGSGRFTAERVAPDNEGNVLLTGAMTTVTPGARARSDYATAKYDLDGHELWVVRYDGPGKENDRPYGLVVDAAGNAYVTGESQGLGTGTDYATVKYAPDGRELWVSRHDGPSSARDGAASIALDAAGDVHVTGISDGGATGLDFVTIKYDGDGNEVWVARFDGPAESYNDGIYPDERFNAGAPLSLVVDSFGNVYVAGSSWGGPGYDYVTIKYAPVGLK